MNNDAPRFDGIKQTVARRADDKPAHRFFKHRRDFWMCAEVLKSCVEFVNKPLARAFGKIFQVREDLEQVVLGTLLSDNLRHPGVSIADRATPPSARRFRDELYAR